MTNLYTTEGTFIEFITLKLTHSIISMQLFSLDITIKSGLVLISDNFLIVVIYVKFGLIFKIFKSVSANFSISISGCERIFKVLELIVTSFSCNFWIVSLNTPKSLVSLKFFHAFISWSTGSIEGGS